MLAPLEGAFAPLGQDAVRGYELAAEEHAERVEALGLEALVESTNGTPESATAKALMLVEQGARIVIGPLSGIESIALRDFARSVPEVTFINGASATQETTLHSPAANFFRFNPDSMQWIAGLGRYAYEEKGIRTIVTVAEDYSLPHTQRMGFVLDYCALGGRELERHWISPGARDPSRIAESVARAEADALFLALSPRMAEGFLRAYGEAGGEAAIVASSTTLSGRLLAAGDALRPLLEGAISALPVSASEDNEAWSEFTERYRERYPDAGATPSLFALAYYVNAKALFLALEEIGAAPAEGHGELRAALAGLRFETPFGGPVSLDANRHAVTGTYIVEVVEGDDDRLEHARSTSCPRSTRPWGSRARPSSPSARRAATGRAAPRSSPRSRPSPASLRAEAEGEPPADEPEPEAEAAEAVADEDETADEAAREVAALAPADHPLLQREEDAAMTGTAPSIVPCLSYADAPAAIAWLKRPSASPRPWWCPARTTPSPTPSSRSAPAWSCWARSGTTRSAWAARATSAASPSRSTSSWTTPTPTMPAPC